MSMPKIVHFNEKSDCSTLKISHKRVQIVFFCMLTTLIILVLRLFDLSIFSYVDLQIDDKKEVIHNIRNNIVDRNGIILASTLPTASAYIYPKHFLNPIKSLNRISEVLNINVKELEERLINNKHFVWLKRHLTPTEQQKLHNLGIPGIYFINDQKRIYPQKKIYFHIL